MNNKDAFWAAFEYRQLYRQPVRLMGIPTRDQRAGRDYIPWIAPHDARARASGQGWEAPPKLRNPA